MANAFEVDSVVLSDYFTQDVNGKSIFAGVYGSELVFSSAPPLLPLLIFNINLKHIQKSFVAEVKFSGPKTKPLAIFDASFQVDGDLSPFATVLFNLQIPYLRFDGPGTYAIEVGEKGRKPHYRKQLNFAVGSGTISAPGSMGVGLSYIAESSAIKF